MRPPVYAILLFICFAMSQSPVALHLSFLFNCKRWNSDIRDGPLIVGVGNFRAARIYFLKHFSLQEYFFRMQELFSGLLAVHEFFLSIFPWIIFFLLCPPPHPHNFSYGPSLNLSLIKFIIIIIVARILQTHVIFLQNPNVYMWPKWDHLIGSWSWIIKEYGNSG